MTITCKYKANIEFGKMQCLISHIARPMHKKKII